MKGFLRKAAVTSIVLLLSLSLLCAVAEAYAVAFTYEGWGIRSKASIGSAQINDQQYVRIIHTQSRDLWRYSGELRVTIQRKVWWGWQDVTSRVWAGDVYNQNWYPWLNSSGNYRLYFSLTENTVDGQSLYIKGSFSK